MDYFDELGGDAVVMDPATFAAASRETRIELVRAAAERMAPSILGRVTLEPNAATIRGQFGVHAASVEIAADTGSFVLRIATRRALRVPDGGLRIQGPPDDRSRRLLDELPHGSGQLLNRLLDSMANHAGSLTLLQHELVLSFADPTRLTLSHNPALRLTSVTHLTAYIASEAEQRWPLDPTEPLGLVSVDLDAERIELGYRDNGDHAPPVPAYGIPPRR